MQWDDLLDGNFLIDLFDRNVGRLNLSQHEVCACRVVPMKLSKTRGKSVVECQLMVEPADGGSPTRRNFVAIWRPDGENAPTFDLMQRLRRWGFDGRGAEAVCEPIAYFGDCNLMLVGKVDGTELEQLLAAGAPSATAAVEGAARWLAKLHATPVKADRIHTYAKEREMLERWVKDLGGVYPAFGGRLQGLAESLLEAERGVRHDNFRLIHGDFHPENIFVNGPRVTVTDFERSCLFDPAADLGFFLCQFEAKVRMGRYALGELERARLRRHFMDGYASQAPETLAWRVGLYEARGYLEIAHYIYCGLHVPADPAEFEFYVQSAERSAGSVA